MSATTTNRSAALCGALQAACLFVYFAFAEHLLYPNDVRWLVNVVVVCIIFFVPFFKWVIGADFKYNGQGLTLHEQWLALPEKYARMAIWGMSFCAIGLTLGLITRAPFK